MVSIKINGKEYEVEEGKRLLQVFKELGIKVPNICYHEALLPAAACKLCVVEIREKGGAPRPRLSCAVKAKAGMEIITDSAMIHQLRTEAIGNLLKMAPHAEIIHKVGREFGLETGPKPDGCIRCRLCIRICADIIGAKALKMVRREGIKYVVPSEAGRCIGCGTCTNICPTGAIRAVDEDNIRTIMIRDEVVGRHPLERCEMCGTYFATSSFLEHVEEREGAHPREKEKHKYCPICTKLRARTKVKITAPHLEKTYGGKPLD